MSATIPFKDLDDKNSNNGVSFVDLEDLSKVGDNHTIETLVQGKMNEVRVSGVVEPMVDRIEVSGEEDIVSVNNDEGLNREFEVEKVSGGKEETVVSEFLPNRDETGSSERDGNVEDSNVVTESGKTAFPDKEAMEVDYQTNASNGDNRLSSLGIQNISEILSSNQDLMVTEEVREGVIEEHREEAAEGAQVAEMGSSPVKGLHVGIDIQGLDEMGSNERARNVEDSNVVTESIMSDFQDKEAMEVDYETNASNRDNRISSLGIQNICENISSKQDLMVTEDVSEGAVEEHQEEAAEGAQVAKMGSSPVKGLDVGIDIQGTNVSAFPPLEARNVATHVSELGISPQVMEVEHDTKASEGSFKQDANQNLSSAFVAAGTEAEVKDQFDATAEVGDTKSGHVVKQKGKTRKQIADPEHPKKSEYASSDLVWGKVKSHPWWPGQIFDPSYASEVAMKHYKKNSFLVAYFGDETFAWNTPLALKPFKANFKEMEKQTNMALFQDAVTCALSEVSRRVELGLSCSCMPAEFYAEMKCQTVINTGIREKVCKTDSADRFFSGTLFEPEKLVKYIKALAQYQFHGCDKLEHVIAEAQLLAFYSSKGYALLPEFHVSEGLSECAENAAPVYENEEKGHIEKGSVIEQQGNLEKDLKARRKERNLTELMVRKKNSSNAVKDADDENIVSKLPPSAKKRKAIDTSPSDAAKKNGKQKLLPSNDFGTESPTSKASKVGERICGIAKQLTGSPPVLKYSGDSSQASDVKVDGRKKELHEVDVITKVTGSTAMESPSSEAGKKSGKQRLLPSNDLGTASPTSRASKVGDRICGIAKQLTGSPPVLKYSGDRFQESDFKVDGREEKLHEVDVITKITGRTFHGPVKTPRKSSPPEMLSQLHLAARDAMKGYSFLTTIVGFFTDFRNSISLECSGPTNLKKFKKEMSSDSKDSLTDPYDYVAVSDSYWTDVIMQTTPEKQLSRKKQKKKAESPVETPLKDSSTFEAKASHGLNSMSDSKNDISTVEPAYSSLLNFTGDSKHQCINDDDNLVGENSRSDEKNSGESSATELVLNFGDANSIPSESELNMIFSRFGSLKESETEILRKNKRARVVFQRRNDADAAYSSSGKFSVFGPALVSYKLMPCKTSSCTTRQRSEDTTSLEGNTIQLLDH